MADDQSLTEQTAPLEPLALEPEREKRIADLQSRYPNKKSTLLPLLWEIQEQVGWVSNEWMDFAAERCEVTSSHVKGVVTFYTMYHQKPAGTYHVQVCRNISCHIMGGMNVIERVEEELGLKNGEVSACGRFSLEHVECLGGCSWAPVMQVNRALHENLDADAAAKILQDLE